MNLNELLDKTSDWDKDERYMATSDLCAELQKDIKIDATIERRICVSVLKQLDDQSNDVQSIAVKCLGVLLKKVQEAQVCEISEKLCSLILDGKDELRDIYSIGLKTLLKDVPEQMGPSVCERLTKRLLSGVAQEEKVEVKLEAFENLTDLLKRFGPVVRKEHAAILDTALAQLESPKAVVRKRAAACLAALSSSADDALLEQLFSTLLDRIEAAGENAESARTLIQTIGTISRAVGGRLGRHLDAVVPVFVRHIGDAGEEETNTEEIDELRENCFQGLESFVLRCPREISPHVATLLQTSMTFTAYDPNYQYDEDDEMEDGSGEDDEDYDDEEDYGNDEDDDDTSWKVRRAAIKLLSAIVTARAELLEELYETVAPALISRFKEREENVRVDVIEIVATLLRAGVGASGGGAKNETNMAYDAQLAKLAPAAMLAGLKQLELGAKKKSSTTGAEKPKAATYAMLRALCAARPGQLGDHVKDLVRACELGLADRSQPLKLDGATLLRCAVDSHDASVFAAYAVAMLPKVADLVRQDWYKLIAEGLRLVSSLAAVTRPNAATRGPLGAPSASSSMMMMMMPKESAFGDAALKTVAKELYEALEPRLKATDIDHEIKECAIAAVGAVATRLGDKLLELPPTAALTTSGDEPPANLLAEVLATLSDRLRNESTRLAALRALGDIASSALELDVSVLLRDQTVAELAALLRQQSRSLKQTALDTLKLLVQGKNLEEPASAQALAAILTGAASLISDDDLHLAHLAIQATVAAVAKAAQQQQQQQQEQEQEEGALEAVADAAATATVPAALALACSPLLQGVALASVGDLFKALVLLAPAAPTKLTFAALSAALTDAAGASSDQAQDFLKKSQRASSQALPKQALSNVGLTLATMSADAPEATRAQAVEDMVAAMTATGSSTTKRHVATLALGELGRRVALDGTVWKALDAVIASTVDDEHKSAAACALGLVTAGGLDDHLAPLLDALDRATAEDHREYLLLVALKEVCVALGGGPVAAAAAASAKTIIHGSSATASSASASATLSAAAPRALARLAKSCDATDEPTRNMVAECLGALAVISPTAVAASVDALLARTRAEDDADARARWTATASLKHAASQPALDAAAIQALGPRVAQALGLLDDANLAVKRQAVVMLNACAHHQPALLASTDLNAVLTMLATLVQLKLERVVDLGPFKHKVDDGETIRKASLACVSTLIDAKLIDCTQIAACVTAALTDKSEDVEIAAQLLVGKISMVAPEALEPHVQPIVDALDKTVNKKPKDSKAATDAERAMALIRSALKAALALAKVPAATAARDFIAKSQKKEKLAAEIARLDPKMAAASTPATDE